MTAVLPFTPDDDLQHLAAITLLRAGAVPTQQAACAVVIRWADLDELEPDPLVAVTFAAGLVLADLDQRGAAE